MHILSREPSISTTQYNESEHADMIALGEQCVNHVTAARVQLAWRQSASGRRDRPEGKVIFMVIHHMIVGI